MSSALTYVTGKIAAGKSTVLKYYKDKGYKVYSTFCNNIPEFQNTNLTWTKVDLSKNNEIYNFIDYIKNEINNIDIFIYTAGMTCRKNFTNILDEDYWNRICASNM